MGTRGSSIIKVDINELIKLLNKAFADEWLAYYQYWIGSKVAKGPMKESVIAELTQHAADELRHATMVADRIIQIGGTPLISPEEWYKMTNCGYDAPKDPYVRVLLEQNIKGEQCAISTYEKILEFVKDKDFVTFNIVQQILQDEVEHEEDLQALMEDLNLMMSREIKK